MLGMWFWALPVGLERDWEMSEGTKRELTMGLQVRGEHEETHGRGGETCTTREVS